MYEEYFGLSGAPFKLNPDPKFFFGSHSHNKAMAYLHYGLKQAEGFIVITGPVGAGKSMLIGHLLDQLDRSNVVAAHLLTSNVEPSELLSHILSAFRIMPEGEGRAGELEAFEDYLFDQLNRGRRVLLILDEAQNLPRNTLEELRMLSNIDYDGTPLFQVFLVGQSEFRETLSTDNMEQLKQRVIASYHLEDLTKDETREYIEHRLAVVGWKKDPAFNEDAYEVIHAETRGRPRRINTVCNRIMLYCSIEKRHEVDAGVVQTVLGELAEERLQSAPLKTRKGEKKKAKVETKAPAKDKRTLAGGEAGDVVVPFQPSPAPSDERATPQSGDPAGDPAPAAVEAKDKSAIVKKKVVKTPPAATPKTKVIQKNAAKEEAQRGAPPAAAPIAAPVVAEDLSGMSVFDRIRAKQANAETAAPAGATMKDVATAIAAVSNGEVQDGKDAARGNDKSETDGDIPAPADDVTLDAPVAAVDPSGWRRSVVRSINDTRDELRVAHSNVVGLRRRLSDIDRRRHESRVKVVASLSRAETLLGEIRDAWR